MKDLTESLPKLSAVISAHVFTTGPPAADLENYLRSRTRELLFISHPFYHSNERKSLVRLYSDGKLEKTYKIPTLSSFGPASYFRDFVVSILTVILSRRRYSLFIGLDALNSLAGLLLQKAGLIDKTVFYRIDYVPSRFKNHVANRIYQSVNILCAMNCDWTWNLSKRMIEDRCKTRDHLRKQLVVPIGSNYDNIKRKASDPSGPHRLAYLGSLRRGQGLELLIDEMPSIRKAVPDAKLVIIGTGPLDSKLKQRAAELELDDCTVFLGYVEDHGQVEETLTTCGIGVAMYEQIPESFIQFTEPGKIKQYMACGLVVITTRLPEIAAEIEDRGAGFVIDYSPEQLVSTIANLARDESLYFSARQSAIKFASEYSWTNIFDKTFSTMLADKAESLT
jgi:glycosyltransferase involved in cell wall biosynthesis